MPDMIGTRADRLMFRVLPARLRTQGFLEAVRYVVIGGLTFIVSNGLFALMYNALHWNHTLSNVIAVVCAVIFAYLTNKKFVFRTRCENKRDLFREALTFFSARAVTFVLEIGGLELLVRAAGLSPNWSKLGLTVLVILINYIFSKLFVFRKGTVKNI